jgi:hypothetical protein
MAAILAPVVLLPGARNAGKRTPGYMRIRNPQLASTTMSVEGFPRSLLRRLGVGLHITTMRLIARFVVLMVAVFGVSLAFAWAWDRSDAPPATQVHGS